MRFITLILLTVLLLPACNAYQPTKNVWKTTKNLWYTYMSPPSSIDYEEKGTLSPRALALTHSMMGIDVELTRLERTMLNADKPPTRDWLASFQSSFPWVNGFAGVKYDGTILGQEPATPIKQLDYIPLLYEDKKQNSHALRADVQNTPLGPEVLIAAPLYDGTDFLGIVVANFDMRSLMQYSKTPQDVIILAPQGLLWPGKYEYAATPLAGVNWEQAVTKSTAGTCTNASGTFYYNVRFLGNLPLVFAVPESGTFPAGNGDVAQGLAFFPKDRPKLPPPAHEERKPRPNFAQGLTPEMSTPGSELKHPEQSVDVAAPQTAHTAGKGGTDIQPGSRESMLLRRKQPERRTRVQERQLEGENIAVHRKPRTITPRPEKPLPPADGLGLSKDLDRPTLPGGRPSPFGPRKDASVPQTTNEPASTDVHTEGTATPSPANETNTSGVATPSTQVNDDSKSAAKETSQSPTVVPKETPAPQDTPHTDTERKDSTEASDRPMLPGGRPSPFGPRN